MAKTKNSDTKTKIEKTQFVSSSDADELFGGVELTICSYVTVVLAATTTFGSLVTLMLAVASLMFSILSLKIIDKHNHYFSHRAHWLVMPAVILSLIIVIIPQLFFGVA